MKYTQYLRPGIVALFVAVVQMLGCYGPVWPSRGMAVKLSDTGPSALEVEGVVASELVKRGFTEQAKNGRDAIKSERTAFSFEGPNKLDVVIQVDLVKEVQIRVSQNHPTFSPEANGIFQALEARWPGSVIREPESTR